MIVLQRPVYDAVTFWGMLLIVAVVSAVWMFQFAKLKKSYGLVFLAAMFILVGLNLVGDSIGIFARVDILPPAFVVMNVVILVLVFSIGLGYLGQLGDLLVKLLSIQTLVSLQIFRLPLEMLMLRASYLGIMPMEFSLLGYNFDVMTGFGGLLLTIYAAWKEAPPKMLIWFWNVMGILLLMVIAVLAALTSPNLHAFGADLNHINSWVLFFPYALLPSVLVSLAVFGHILLTRKLLHYEKHT
jgi:hypothetical protein